MVKHMLAKCPKCLSFNRELAILSPPFAAKAAEQSGAVAQLGERCVRNAEVEGSTPFRSTGKALFANPANKAFSLGFVRFA